MANGGIDSNEFFSALDALSKERRINKEVLFGAIEAARERGLRIPEDFGIVGTANEAFTSLMTPSMSSLALNPFEMGRQAAQAFLAGEEGTVVVPMELKVRESSCRNKQQNLSI